MEYILDFKGYCPEHKIQDLPTSSGIYCVYACTCDFPNRTVSIRKLLYIGESHDVKNRVERHERWDDWKAKLLDDEALCVSVALIGNAKPLGLSGVYAPSFNNATSLSTVTALLGHTSWMDSMNRKQAEAAMIYKHEPPCNVEHMYKFDYPDTTIETKGENFLLSVRFTVYRTPSPLIGLSRLLNR